MRRPILRLYRIRRLLRSPIQQCGILLHAQNDHGAVAVFRQEYRLPLLNDFFNLRELVL